MIEHLLTWEFDVLITILNYYFICKRLKPPFSKGDLKEYATSILDCRIINYFIEREACYA